MGHRIRNVLAAAALMSAVTVTTAAQAEIVRPTIANVTGRNVVAKNVRSGGRAAEADQSLFGAPVALVALVAVGVGVGTIAVVADDDDDGAPASP